MGFYIGNVLIKNKVVMAPMAGITNLSFRRLAKENCAGLVFSEMISDKGLIYGDKGTKELIQISEYDRPIAMQIFGNDPTTLAKATRILCETVKPDIIDINMGCPVPKVAIKSSSGAALLKDEEKIRSIVRGVVRSSSVPVTVKIRSGWDKTNINAINVAKICEEEGASGITVHPRTRSEFYTGVSDWEIIKQVKEVVSIPVIGSGDIKNIDDALRMLRTTNCDAIMIGRGTLGNIHLLKQIASFLDNGEMIPDLTYEEKIEACLKHLSYLVLEKCEKVAVLEMRSHAAWYVKGIPGSKEIKEQIMKVSEKIELENLLKKYLLNLTNSIK